MLRGISRPLQTHAAGAPRTKLFHVVQFWMQRHSERAALEKLDPHMLRDIGMSRDNAHEESYKSFWRD